MRVPMPDGLSPLRRFHIIAWTAKKPQDPKGVLRDSRRWGLNDMSKSRRLVRAVIASFLIALTGVALYIFVASGDAVLVAIALFLSLFIAMTALAVYVLERGDESGGPGSEEKRLASFWRLPPR